MDGPKSEASAVDSFEMAGFLNPDLRNGDCDFGRARPVSAGCQRTRIIGRPDLQS
jgi:hypothetical protein